MSEQGLDSNDAADHLQMVDRILAQADRQVRLLPEPFIAFGISGGLSDIVSQRIFVNHNDPRLGWIAVLGWIAAIIITIVSSRRRRRKKERWSVLDGQLYTLFTIIWITTLAVAFGSQLHVFTQWAVAAIWSFAYGIALIFVGTQGNRYTLVGGIILIASIIGANILYPYIGYVLAAGMWIGMAGTGVALYATQRK